MVHKPKDASQEHLDDLLDAALAGTFPASDPVAHLVKDTKGAPPPDEGKSSLARRMRAGACAPDAARVRRRSSGTCRRAAPGHRLRRTYTRTNR